LPEVLQPRACLRYFPILITLAGTAQQQYHLTINNRKIDANRLTKLELM
jgi:hypothetical protein